MNVRFLLDRLPLGGGPAGATKPPGGGRLSRAFVLSSLLGVGAVMLVALGAGWIDVYRSVPMAAPDTEVERLQEENRALSMEIELASRKEPYLVLDLSAPSLTLKSNGVPLRAFPVREASVRSRRFLGIWNRGTPAPDTVWEGGGLMPPRKLKRDVIVSDNVSPPDKVGTVSVIPPAPEEENPTFPSFRVRFNGGLSTFVLAGEEEWPSGDDTQAADSAGPAGVAHPSVFTTLLRWIRMQPWRRDLVRLDIVLPPPDAGALYRALTDGVSLLVMGDTSS